MMAAVRELDEIEIDGRRYRRGDLVAYVGNEVRFELPLPRMFFILRVTPGRDAKVIQAYRQRDVSAWSPTLVRVVDRRDGSEARRPHLGKTISKPMLPGLIFIPDFDADRVVKVDHVESWLQLGPRLATLSPAGMAKLLEIEAALNMATPQARKAALKQLVRITTGQFANFVGEVERLDSGGRLKVFIAALMSGASVILDEAQIEPVTQREARATARRSKRRYR